MSTRSRPLSPKARANREFADEVNYILSRFAELVRLQEFFFRNVKPGHYLHYNQNYAAADGSVDHREYNLTKKDLRGLYAQLRQRIKDLKALFRKKKCRGTVDLALLLDPAARPADWPLLLKGQNRVSVATPNLVGYLGAEDFGQVNPPRYGADGSQLAGASGGALADRLPILTQGFGLKAAFALLFFHAIRVADVTGRGGGHLDPNDHRKNYFTPAMAQAFGSGITPYRYTRFGENGAVDDSEPDGVKIPNDDPNGYTMNGKTYPQVRQSTIDYLASGKYRGQYSTIRQGGRDVQGDLRLTDEWAHLTTVQTILNLNIKDFDNDLSAAEAAYWDDTNNIASAVAEYIDAKDVRQAWVDALKPVTDIRRKIKRGSPRRSPMGANVMAGGRKAPTAR